MTGSPTYTCNDYRDEMTLVALQNRLNSVMLSDEERRQIKEEIQLLEKRIGIK